MFFLIWIFTSNLTKKQEIHLFIMLNLAACGGTFFDRITSEFRNSETRFTRFSYILYILNISGPDLVLQGRRTQLQSGYFTATQVDRTQVAPGRACLSCLKKEIPILSSYSQNDASGCLAGRVIC